MEKEKREKVRKYKAMLIFGPPGAGKGTQAKLICENKKYLHFSTGDMFRGLKNNPEMANSDIGKKIIEIMPTGNLVPDDLTIQLLFKTLEEYSKEKKFDPENQILLLDGIPRNVSQVLLIKEKIEVIKIVNLRISNYDEIVSRLVKRAELENRHDDRDPNIVRKRLGIYDKETHAVLEKYPKEIIINVDGIGKVEDIHREIISRL